MEHLIVYECLLNFSGYQGLIRGALKRSWELIRIATAPFC